MPPVCSNCGGNDFVWVNDLKTGTIGRGGLSLRTGGELSLGTRLCRNCGHADLFLKDPGILRMPHTWRPGEFVPIPARPAPAAPSAAATPTPTAPAHAPPPPTAPLPPPPAPAPPPVAPLPAPTPAPPPEAVPDPTPVEPMADPTPAVAAPPPAKSAARKRGGRAKAGSGEKSAEP